MHKPTATLDTVLLTKSDPTPADDSSPGKADAMNQPFKPENDLADAPTMRDPAHGMAPTGRKSGSIKFAYASGSRPLDGYTIKRGIGAGGFGEVYFAVSDGGKEVALKRIQRNLDIELRGVTQCLNLKHQNLVALFDIRHDDHGQSWVVMEYVTGESLKDVIDRHPSGMQPESVLYWLRGIVAGVDYLHDHGIVHRDLKPGNIFLDDDVVKIGDYGLSKFISCSRRGGQTESVGTFHYMAPEIGKGSYGKEIDLYALGVMIYEMLTGRVPFDGESGQEIIMKHLTDTPKLTDLPPPYRAVVAKALAKDPALRFGSAAELLAAVDAGLAGVAPVLLQPAPDPERNGATGFANPAAPIAATRPGNRPSTSAVPPVRKEILYIGDEPDDDIVLGDVKEIVTAEPVQDGRKPAHRPPARPEPPRPAPPPSPPRPEGGPRAFAVGAQPASPAMGGRVKPATNRPVAVGVAGAGAAGAVREVMTISDEPIACAVQSGCGKVRQWWTAANFSTPVKLILLLSAALLVILNSEWLVPVALVLGAVYLIYFGVRSLSLAFRGATEEANAGHAASAAAQNGARNVAAPRRRLGRKSKQEALRQAVLGKSFNERTTEVIGAMLAAFAVIAALSLLLVLLGGATLVGSVFGWTFYAWMTLTATFAAWSVLVASKVWEGKDGDQFRRRFVMLAAGLVVGVMAWASSEMLMVEFTDSWDNGPALASEVLSTNLHDAQGGPTLPVFLAYFAGLFVILRWWLQADPLRTARLSLVATGACVFWAWILDLIWRFPQPWGLMLAAVISIAVQLASPWLGPKAKAKIIDAYQEA
jgi:serine/threonine protein kinase